MSQLTKRAITESFMKLINQVPFDKITVKDIVEDCGVNRNTFYYHYSDIYALLDEILENETKRVLTENLAESSWRDAILESCSFALKNKINGMLTAFNTSCPTFAPIILQKFNSIRSSESVVITELNEP